MRRFTLSVLVLSATFIGFAAPAATNATVSVVSAVATTNAPAVKLSRQQCEAVTKSGTRCKRNAAPGEKLCRQHKKVAAKKAK